MFSRGINLCLVLVCWGCSGKVQEEEAPVTSLQAQAVKGESPVQEGVALQSKEEGLIEEVKLRDVERGVMMEMRLRDARRGEIEGRLKCREGLKTKAKVILSGQSAGTQMYFPERLRGDQVCEVEFKVRHPVETGRGEVLVERWRIEGGKASKLRE